MTMMFKLGDSVVHVGTVLSVNEHRSEMYISFESNRNMKLQPYRRARRSTSRTRLRQAFLGAATAALAHVASGGVERSACSLLRHSSLHAVVELNAALLWVNTMTLSLLSKQKSIVTNKAREAAIG